MIAGAFAAAPRHIVLVLSDDLGTYAPSYNNPDLQTPMLAELAQTGAVLTAFYAYKYCSPSRASFLTGRYPFKTESVRNNLIPFSQEDGVNLNFTMLPAKLKEAGYSSHFVGKWHQGFWRPDYLPLSRGFDSANGFLAGGQDHFTQQSFGECKCPQKDIWVNTSIDPALQGVYNARRFTDAAVTAIENNDAAATPLFLYVALQNVHAPMEADPFWEGLYPHVSYKLRKSYMAMMSTIDSSVANITAALKRTGHWNSTLFVWASDNGSPVNVGGSNWPYKGGKGSNWEGGVRMPALLNGGLLAEEQRGRNFSGLVHISDFYATFASIAGVSPYDGDWAPVDGLDQTAYLVEGTASTSPRTRIVHQHDMFTGSSVGALRDGDFKLIVNTEDWSDWYGDSSAGHFTPPEHGNTTNIQACSPMLPCLYNITADPLEQRDLAASMPSVVASMLTIFHSYDSEHHPPPTPPPSNATACCAVSATNGGYLAPWGSS